VKQEDIFDIVNEQDEVIGHAPRSEVHARGLLHRAAHIWVYNRHGQILIQLRSASKDRHPRTWDSSASGHVDHGESYDIAAHREVMEELGLTENFTLEEIDYAAACADTGQEFVKVYRLFHEGPFRPCPEEIDELRWADPGELEQWMRDKPEEFAPALPYLWRRLHNLESS